MDAEGQDDADFMFARGIDVSEESFLPPEMKMSFVGDLEARLIVNELGNLTSILLPHFLSTSTFSRLKVFTMSAFKTLTINCISP